MALGRHCQAFVAREEHLPAECQGCDHARPDLERLRVRGVGRPEDQHGHANGGGHRRQDVRDHFSDMTAMRWARSDRVPAGGAIGAQQHGGAERVVGRSDH